MKKIIATVAICSMAVMTGCVRTENTDEVNVAWNNIDSGAWVTAYKVVEIEGHRYVVTRIPNGVSTVHAESCSCRIR